MGKGGVYIMAKTKVKTRSADPINTKMLMVLVIGIVAGFFGGFFFARDRYTDKIASISEMNMEKAVTIDSLNRQVEVLGASTKAGN